MATGPDGCKYFDGNGGSSMPPYVYFDALANGSFLPVAAKADSSSGLCYFPIDCVTRECCTFSPWVSEGQSHSTSVVNLLSAVLFFGCFLLLTKWLSKLQEERLASHPETVSDKPPSGTSYTSNQLGVYLGVTMSVFTSVIMAVTTQTQLSVAHRNAQMASDAFLTPMKDIFQFLEDTTSVKITFSIGTGDFEPIRMILLVGVVGGLASGVLGALAMTGLAFWPQAITELLAPGSAQMLERYPSCPLLSSPEVVVGDARNLWLLTSWSWPLQFMAMVLTGLLMGAREFAHYGIAQILAMLTLLAIWFGSPLKDLNVLGKAVFLSSAVFCFAQALLIARNHRLRTRFGLLKQRTIFASGGGGSRSNALGESLRHGLLAMTLDLVLQASGTISVYVAGFQSLEVLYQLSAANAAMPAYTCYANGLSYMVKLSGAFLIGAGLFKQFGGFMTIMLGLSLVLGIVSVFSIFPYKEALSSFYALPSCRFASNQECLGVYGGLFGDSSQGTVFDTFTVVGISSLIVCVFSVAKAGLYACQDFAFMAKSSTLVFVLVFLPSLLVARCVLGNATALYTASVLPTWVLTLVFIPRLQWNYKQMLNGSAGFGASLLEQQLATHVQQGTA
eukprot:TRINITY_DN29190_c0_g1_i1.p1 TRINITY_DN29190_c0_g1~~TRINITY_DN29190_c0_g1_i1.p1  ORF type:complete len:618 (-),score=100.64 TRINITY_DN29190_c0_g1_i1:158-2011(-)